jgi:hypothetical protein
MYRQSSTASQQQQEQDQEDLDLQQDLQQEDAVAALAAMKYSPVVPGMLGAAPHETPTTLLPIPASLRASSEPEDPQANGWAVLHRLQRSSGPPPYATASVRPAAAVDDGDSELSGWSCCSVCGIRLDSSLSVSAWHVQQHLQTQPAIDALNAHMQRSSNLARRSPELYGLFYACSEANGPNRTRCRPARAALLQASANRVTS